MGKNTDSASLCPYLCLLQGRSLVLEGWEAGHLQVRLSEAADLSRWKFPATVGVFRKGALKRAEGI